MFDYSKLRGRIREKYDTQAKFANDLGISEPTMSERLNNKSEFSQAEINKACELLDISFMEIPQYFFIKKV